MNKHYYVKIGTTVAIRIGFDLLTYTYIEPQYDEIIDKYFSSPMGRPENGPVFIVKKDNVTTEQTFLLEVQVTNSVPSGTTNIQPATNEQDYRVGSGFSMTQTDCFRPFHQKISFGFELFSDTLPEGTEAFQITFSPLPSRISSDGLTVI